MFLMLFTTIPRCTNPLLLIEFHTSVKVLFVGELLMFEVTFNECSQWSPTQTLMSSIWVNRNIPQGI